jgi:hypothetical protein
MEKKMDFIEKYLELSAKISKERTDVLKHHLNYITRQHAINLSKEEDNKKLKKRSHDLDSKENNTLLKERIKYKPGGGPAKDRKIVNEKYKLSIEQIQEIRKQSHFFCQKNITKIDIERKEKIRNIMLPLIKN